MAGNSADRDTATAALPAPAAGVMLWWCTLAAPAARVRVLEGWLSAAEIDRADRFGTAVLRERYIVGRASLRGILGELLAMDPRDVPIVRGERGRPQLGLAVALDFNVSHTADVALIGATRDARIGVDVERLDREINVGGIARKFLTQTERRALADLDADSARRRVLRLWTCKEAISKSTGDALSAPFGSLDVALGDAPRLCAGPAPYEPSRWTLHSAPVPADFVATVALWRP